MIPLFEFLYLTVISELNLNKDIGHARKIHCSIRKIKNATENNDRCTLYQYKFVF